MEEPFPGCYRWKIPSRERASPCSTIISIPHREDSDDPNFDWAAVIGLDQIPRRCPVCLSDSISGHGLRDKQAHDESHDWIIIRRGFCNICEITFTFLPALSLPYTHYSQRTRGQAVRRSVLEDYPLENAVPPLKDPNRFPDPSTVRRWSHDLDSSRPAFSFLRPTLRAINDWLAQKKQLRCGPWVLSWPNLYPFLRFFWPLRL